MPLFACLWLVGGDIVCYAPASLLCVFVCDEHELQMLLFFVFFVFQKRLPNRLDHPEIFFAQT